jgi:tetratricopeptide (TPR) repeat protein
VTGIPAARAGTVPPVSAAAAGAPTAAGDAETPAAAPSPILPWDTAAEEYLRRAREEYQGERYPQSLAILDQFLERFPRGSDEAYWLYAQICEKQGPSRNIRLALDYYRRLTAEYPQSSHYDAARRRIAYLERYYINIQ